MITSRDSTPIHKLAEKHLEAQVQQLHWTAVWKVFSDDDWFNGRLDASANYLVRRNNLPVESKNDVQQEALIQFAKSIERDISLGFDPERGEYGAYLATIINRCCQKGMRQFRNMTRLRIENESQHPVLEEWESVVSQIDLHESIKSIPEPYRETVLLTCDGLSIAAIAKCKGKSPRTIYRWLEKGISCLRTRLVGASESGSVDELDAPIIDDKR